MYPGLCTEFSNWTRSCVAFWGVGYRVRFGGERARLWESESNEICTGFAAKEV